MKRRWFMRTNRQAAYLTARHSFSYRMRRVLDRSLNPVMLIVLIGFAIVATYGLFVQDMYLCLETIFLGFIPFIFWSAYRRTGSLDFFAPDVGFPVAYIVFLFVGSISFPIQSQFGLVLPWVVWLYYVIGLVAYLMGGALLRSTRASTSAQVKPKHFWISDRFLSGSLILLAVGAGARAIEIATAGLEIFHANNESARVTGARGMLGVLSLSLEAAFECLLLYLLVKKPKGILRAFLIISLVFILLNAVATTDRTGLLRIAVAGVVIVHYTKWRFKLVGVLAIAISAFVFASVLGTFRDVSDWGQARINSLEKQGFTDQTYWLMSGYDVVRLPTETFYMAIQEVPVITPYSYGATSLASLTEILPGHRPGPSEIVKNTLRLEFVGFGAAATILAPLWFDGGVLGIVIGMFLFGLISRLLYQRMLLSNNYVWLLLYGWFVQNAFKAIKDDILPDLGVPLVMFLFVVVCFLTDRPSEDLVTVGSGRQLQREGAA